MFLPARLPRASPAFCRNVRAANVGPAQRSQQGIGALKINGRDLEACGAVDRFACVSLSAVTLGLVGRVAGCSIDEDS